MDDDNINGLPTQHGGDGSRLLRRYPDAPKPMLDLSTGVNPYAYPVGELRTHWLHVLADPAQIEAAVAAAARYYSTGRAHVTLGCGTQPLASALASLRFHRNGVARTAILGFTYGEHAHIWRAAGHDVHETDTPDALEEYDVAVVVNPNNPDGATLGREEILRLARALAGRSGWLLIDEAFADMRPGASVADAVERHENIAVFRSCGKFFGLAGLRVSAAIAPAEWTQWLRAGVGPWPISTIACHVLPGMFEDAAWAASMRARLHEEAQAWRATLRARYRVLGHTDLFTLVEIEDARREQDRLAAQGIWVRAFARRSAWLRFGLPPKAQLARIKAAL